MAFRKNNWWKETGGSSNTRTANGSAALGDEKTQTSTAAVTTETVTHPAAGMDRDTGKHAWLLGLHRGCEGGEAPLNTSLVLPGESRRPQRTARTGTGTLSRIPLIYIRRSFISNTHLYPTTRPHPPQTSLSRVALRLSGSSTPN